MPVVTTDLRRRIAHERSRRLAETAVEAVALLGVDPSPANIALLYAYADHADPLLRREVDRLLEAGAPVDQARLDALATRFLAGGGPTTGDPMADATLSRVRAGNESARERAVGLAGEIGESLEEAVEAARLALAAIARDARSSGARVAGIEARLSDAVTQLGELVRRIERAERFAATDALTGLPNRRSFEEGLRELVAEAATRPLSLAMFDVDRFKNFNDRHGHDVGDHVLRLIARAIAAYPGGDRLAARHGGEEFALLLPGVVLADAVRVADTIREGLARRRLHMRGGFQLLDRVTVSAGVAQLREGEGPDNLVRRTDVALYRAKTAGRNRVVVDDGGVPRRD
jgi:diguanylate cyclase